MENVTNTDFNSYIQKGTEMENYISFKTECGCFAHDLSVHFERNEKDKNIELVLYDQVYFEEQCDQSCSLFKRFLSRLKLAWKCLFDGYFQVEHGFVFKNNDHVKQFIDYINHCYDKFNSCDEIDKKRENKNSNKYLVHKLPWGWSIDDINIKLLDLTTIDNDDDINKQKLIKIKYEDNGAGHFAKLTFIDGNSRMCEMPIDPDSIKEIGDFVNDIGLMIDDSYDKAYEETKYLWKKH